MKILKSVILTMFLMGEPVEGQQIFSGDGKENDDEVEMGTVVFNLDKIEFSKMLEGKEENNYENLKSEGTFEGQLNQDIEVSVDENITTGYSWSPVVNTCTTNGFLSEPLDSAGPLAGIAGGLKRRRVLVGRSSRHIWTYKTTGKTPSEGCTLAYMLKRPWEADSTA